MIRRIRQHFALRAALKARKAYADARDQYRRAKVRQDTRAMHEAGEVVSRTLHAVLRAEARLSA